MLTEIEDNFAHSKITGIIYDQIQKYEKCLDYIGTYMLISPDKLNTGVYDERQLMRPRNKNHEPVYLESWENLSQAEIHQACHIAPTTDQQNLALKLILDS